MQTCNVRIVSNNPLKGFPFKVIAKDSDNKIQGLRAVVTEKSDGTQDVTITYKSAQAERIIGMQSSGKQLVRFMTFWKKDFSKVTKTAKEGGVYSKGRLNKQGHVIGGTYAYWVEDNILYRSNYPDVKGSRRALFEREVVGTWTKNNVPVLFPLPETMNKKSGLVYRTNGTNDLLSEARRLGWRQD